jgi:hypothetical protein
MVKGRAVLRLARRVASVVSCRPAEWRAPTTRFLKVVRAENHVRGSEQQSCPPGAPAVMITDHVPAVRVPPDNATGRVAAAVPA